MTSDRRALLLLAVAVEGGLAVAALPLGWLLGIPVWETLRWTWLDAALGLAFSLPMLILFGVCLNSPFESLRPIRDFLNQVIYPLFAPLSLAELALICVLAGLGEEWFFRALVQGGLAQWLGPWPALLLASLLFGLAHAITPTYALLATAIGLYLGGCWLLTGNLLAPVIAHGFYDFVALVYLLRIQPPPPAPFVEELPPPTPVVSDTPPA